jgi:transposase
MKAYSLDLRDRILQAAAEGLSTEDVAETFGVSAATVRRYVARQRRTGSVTPGQSPGRPRLIPAAAEAALQAQLAATPDATLAEHQAEWHQTQGVVLSLATLCRAIARVAWTRKKRLSMPVNKMPARVPRGGHM